MGICKVGLLRSVRMLGPEEFESVTNGYRLEIERMQAEVLEYLLRPLPAEHEEQFT